MDKDVRYVLISFLIFFIFGFSLNFITIVLPYIQIAFNLESNVALWVSIAFAVSATASGLVSGKIIPKVGIIKISIISLIVLIISSIIAFVTPNPYIIIVIRFIQGFICSCLGVCAYLFIVKYVSPLKIGRGLGFGATGVFLAYLISPTISGFISQYLFWRLNFIILIPIFVIILLLLYSVPEYKEDIVIDKIGTILSFIGIFLFTTGVSFLNESLGPIILILSIIILVLFVKFELKTENPLFDFRLLKNKLFALNNYSAMVGCFINDGLIFVLTLYLLHINFLTSLEVGIMMSVSAGIMIIMSPIIGNISDYYDSVKLVTIGLVILTISTFILCLSDFTGIIGILVALYVLSIGFSIFETPNKKIVFKTVEDDDLADASAFLSTIRDFGTLLATVIFSLILNIVEVGSPNSVSWILSAKYMFLVFFVMSISTLLLNLYINKHLEIILRFRFEKLTNPIVGKLNRLSFIKYELFDDLLDELKNYTSKTNPTRREYINKINQERTTYIKDFIMVYKIRFVGVIIFIVVIGFIYHLIFFN